MRVSTNDATFVKFHEAFKCDSRLIFFASHSRFHRLIACSSVGATLISNKRSQSLLAAGAIRAHSSSLLSCIRYNGSDPDNSRIPDFYSPLDAVGC